MSRKFAAVLLAVVAMAALAAIFYVLLQWWSAYHFYSLSSADVKDKLDAYKVQVDDLQRLVSLLIAFSSLYALVLGASAYLSSQGLLDQSKENAKKIDTLRSDLEKSFPFFKRMGDHLLAVAKKLEELMPDSDERDDYYDRLSPTDHQELAGLEQGAIAFLYFLDFTEVSHTASDIYRQLGKYCGAAFAERKKQLEKELAETRKAPADPEVRIDVPQRRREIEWLRDRARFLLYNATRTNPDSFLAFNDLAFLIQDIEGATSATAADFYRTSLRLQPKQQRAYYNLAIIEFTLGSPQSAEELSTKALANPNWQVRPNPSRCDDVYYNRACYRSRLGESRPHEAAYWLDGVESDLKTACHAKNQALLTRLEADSDKTKDSDLKWFAAARPGVIAELKKILAG
jgi:preprotein translocase subunit SecG